MPVARDKITRSFIKKNSRLFRQHIRNNAKDVPTNTTVMVACKERVQYKRWEDELSQKHAAGRISNAILDRGKIELTNRVGDVIGTIVPVTISGTASSFAGTATITADKEDEDDDDDDTDDEMEMNLKWSVPKRCYKNVLYFVLDTGFDVERKALIMGFHYGMMSMMSVSHQYMPRVLAVGICSFLVKLSPKQLQDSVEDTNAIAGSSSSSSIGSNSNSSSSSS
jgi:hypothetical protein